MLDALEWLPDVTVGPAIHPLDAHEASIVVSWPSIAVDVINALASQGVAKMSKEAELEEQP